MLAGIDLGCLPPDALASVGPAEVANCPSNWIFASAPNPKPFSLQIPLSLSQRQLGPLPRRCLVMSADIFRGHNWGGSVTGIYQVKAQDAAKHPTVHRTDPTRNNQP